MNKNIEKFQKTIDIYFEDPGLLLLAFTHKSFGVNSQKKEWNERLEFLGDSILSAVVADYLYMKFPEADEKILSRIKSYIVSRSTLVRWAKELGLGDYMLLSQNEESTGGRKKESIVGNAYEAILGAIFLEKGYLAVKAFVSRKLDTENLEKILQNLHYSDFKSELQEIIQEKYKILPVYSVVNETGPEHNKEFEMIVKLKRTIIGKGTGKNKKEAEQKAAQQGLEFIEKNGI